MILQISNLFQALGKTTTAQQNKNKQKQTNKQKGVVVFLTSHPIFHRFSPFNCCLSVVLYLDKRDYPENSHAVFCPYKQHSFEPFICLKLLISQQYYEEDDDDEEEET